MSEHEDTLAMLARCGQHQVGEAPTWRERQGLPPLDEVVSSADILRVFDAFKGVR